MPEIKKYSTKIETWGSSIIIRAFDKKDAEELARILFKIPIDIKINATIEKDN